MSAPVSLARLTTGWLAGGSRNRDLGGIVRLGGQHEGVCVSTPAAVSMLRGASAGEQYTKSRQQPCFAIRWAAACLCAVQIV